MKKDKNKKDKDFEDISIVESTEDGLEIIKKDKNSKLKEEIKKIKKEKEDYLSGWQRAKADYINLQREMEEIRLNSSVFAKEKMLENLLPALDSFDIAFSDKNFWEKVDKEWRTGIESIYQQIISGLEKSDIQKINEKGIPFNPAIHQSVEKIETKKKEEDQIVEEVLQIGYRIGDRTIRPAKVKILEHKNHS